MRKLITGLLVALSLGALSWTISPVSGQPTSTSKEPILPDRVPVIDVDSPTRSLYKIGVPNLVGDAALGARGAETLRNDLRLVSLFEVLDSRSFVADIQKEGLGLQSSAWTVVGAQGVVKGCISRTGRRINVELRLYELARGGSPTLSQSYRGSPGQLRRFMHRFANQVLRVLTGTPGAFDSRLVFARKKGPGRKDIYVAGMDGAGVRRVSSGRGVSMLPAFGPGGVWYSVLTPKGMFITHTGTNERPVIGGGGLNMGVSICGKRAYFSSTRGGNSEIYTANVDGTGVRRLTHHPAIDVSPACGGPGGQIAFVSSRHGSPQIFTMNSGGGNVKRVTFRGSYNQTPAWCPDASKSLLAFTGRSGGMDIFTVDIKAQEYTRISQGQGVNKDPAFSPDCRMIAFASSRGGIFISNPQGLNHQRVVRGTAETLRWSR